MASTALPSGAVPAKPKRPVTERLRDLWPDIWALVRPRRKLLLMGFVLIIISRLCGLVLPASSRYLIDDVIGKHDPSGHIHFEREINNLLPGSVSMLVVFSDDDEDFEPASPTSR